MAGSKCELALNEGGDSKSDMKSEDTTESSSRSLLSEIDYLSCVSGGGYLGGSLVTHLHEDEFLKVINPTGIKCRMNR